MRLRTLYIVITAILFTSEVLYLSLYSNLNATIVLYSYVSIINSILFFIVCLLLRKFESPEKKLTLLVVSAGIVFRISLLFLSPTASDDINRYIWDGKVMANGINPYQYPPNDVHLNSLHSESIPKNVNFPSMKTIYPPIAQLIFLTSYKLFGESFTGFKFILFFFETGTILLLLMILKQLKLPPHFAGFYALCPLPVMQFMVDGHVDAIGLPILLLSLLFFFMKKKTWFYIFSGLSISTKLISGMTLPYTIDKLEKNYSRKFLFAILPLLIFALTYLPFLTNHVFPFESLATFTANWAFNGSAYTVFYNLLPDNQKARLISAVLFLVYGLYLYFSKKEVMNKVFLIFFAFFLLSPTVHPWYLTWLAVLLPLNFCLSGLAFITMINLANFVVINYRLEGIWELNNTMLFLEYLPVYGFMVWELFHGYWQQRTAKSHIS